MKIYNVFYINFLQKTSINILISQLNKLIPWVIINNKKKRRLKVFWML